MPNKYVRNGEVQFVRDGRWHMALLYGKALYAPGTPFVSSHLWGQPHEMIFTVAGTTYYPTPSGYVLIESQAHNKI